MSLRSTGLNPELRQYILDKSLRELDILKAIRDENINHNQAHQQISEEQAQFITFFLKSMKAEYALELGVYFGYSAISIAEGLTANGKLVACEKNEEYAKVAQSYFNRSDVTDKIELRLGSAMSTINDLMASNLKGKFDFIFIDADKSNYIEYYEKSLELVRKGGIVAVDNVLWYERVLDEKDKSKLTKIICELNTIISNDDRVDITMIPIGDGMTLARKK
jgi:caffeoyl-CoA O-methyltransferase